MFISGWYYAVAAVVLALGIYKYIEYEGYVLYSLLRKHIKLHQFFNTFIVCYNVVNSQHCNKLFR
jgi:hypothetical protein